MWLYEGDLGSATRFLRSYKRAHGLWYYDIASFILFLCYASTWEVLIFLFLYACICMVLRKYITPRDLRLEVVLVGTQFGQYLYGEWGNPTLGLFAGVCTWPLWSRTPNCHVLLMFVFSVYWATFAIHGFRDAERGQLLGYDYVVCIHFGLLVSFIYYYIYMFYCIFIHLYILLYIGICIVSMIIVHMLLYTCCSVCVLICRVLFAYSQLVWFISLV